MIFDLIGRREGRLGFPVKTSGLGDHDVEVND